jgi:hypothetical protein
MHTLHEYIEYIVLVNKRRVIDRCHDEYGFSRQDMDVAWELLAQQYSLASVQKLLIESCKVFKKLGMDFSVEKIHSVLSQVNNVGEV